MQHLVVFLLATVACSSSPTQLPTAPETESRNSHQGNSHQQRLTAKEAERIAAAFFAQATEIHATSDQPDLPDTRVIERLRPCQLAPMYEVRSPQTKRFFPKRQFFVGLCANGDRAVVSIVPPTATVKMLKMSPHVRGLANEHDEISVGAEMLKAAEDAQAYASVFYELIYMRHISPALFIAKPITGDAWGKWKVTTEVDGKTITATIGLDAENRYSVGAHQGIGLAK